MRSLILATATGLVALTTSFATPATAQGNLAVISDLCRDMTRVQIDAGIAEMAEDGYKFSTDPDRDNQAKQTAYDLCGAGYNADAAEADTDEQPETIPAAVGPPQHGPKFSGPEYERNMPKFSGPVYERNMPVFHHNGPPSRQYGHHGRKPPPWFMNKRPSPPRYGQRHPAPHRFAPRRPAPPYHAQRPRSAPLTAMARSHGHSDGYESHREERRVLQHKRVRSAGYCLAERSAEAYEAKYPRPRASCEIGPIPGAPCPGWVCDGP